MLTFSHPNYTITVSCHYHISGVPLTHLQINILTIMFNSTDKSMFNTKHKIFHNIFYIFYSIFQISTIC